MSTFDLTKPVKNNLRGDDIAKFRVANDTQRDALITGDLVKLGHIIYHETDDKHYTLKAYPTYGDLTGVVWEEFGNGVAQDTSPPLVSTITVSHDYKEITVNWSAVADNDGVTPASSYDVVFTVAQMSPVGSHYTEMVAGQPIGNTMSLQIDIASNSAFVAGAIFSAKVVAKDSTGNTTDSNSIDFTVQQTPEVAPIVGFSIGSIAQENIVAGFTSGGTGGVEPHTYHWFIAQGANDFDDNNPAFAQTANVTDGDTVIKQRTFNALQSNTGYRVKLHVKDAEGANIDTQTLVLNTKTKGNFYYDLSQGTLVSTFRLSEPIKLISSFKIYLKIGNTTEYIYPYSSIKESTYTGSNSEAISTSYQANEYYKHSIQGETNNPFGWIQNTGSGALFNPSDDWVVLEYTIVSSTQHRIRFLKESDDSVLVERVHTLTSTSYDIYMTTFMELAAAEPVLFKQLEIDDKVFDLNEPDTASFSGTNTDVKLQYLPDHENQNEALTDLLAKQQNL